MVGTVQGTLNPTLLDLAKLKDPDGNIATVVEILNETNEVLEDMSWVEGNLETGHRTTVRTGIPAPTWRKLYGGVAPTKSTTVQVTDETGMLEAYAEVDMALADLNNNTQAFRLSEDRAHIEGMNQEMADTLFYGNETAEPEAFTGLSPRFNDGSSSATNRDSLVNGGGTGSDNASIWLVVWGPQTCHGIVPKGSTAGISVKDLGEVTVMEGTGPGVGMFQAYRTHYRWDAGLTVRDWRYVVRIPNIDKSELNAKITGNSANLPDLMFQAMERVPNLSMGRPVFYMARDIRTALRQQVPYATEGSTLTMENVGGRMITSFQGIPVRRVDALAGDEAVVPF